MIEVLVVVLMVQSTGRTIAWNACSDLFKRTSHPVILVKSMHEKLFRQPTPLIASVCAVGARIGVLRTEFTGPGRAWRLKQHGQQLSCLNNYAPHTNPHSHSYARTLTSVSQVEHDGTCLYLINCDQKCQHRVCDRSHTTDYGFRGEEIFTRSNYEVVDEIVGWPVRFCHRECEVCASGVDHVVSAGSEVTEKRWLG